MLTVAVLCVIVPLSRRKEEASDFADQSFYEDQLAAIEARATESDADADTLAQERDEIARRLLRSARQHRIGKTVSQNKFAITIASLAGLLVVPAISIGGYLYAGAVGVSDVPLSAQMNRSINDQSVDQLVQTAESHLAKNPDDPKGWRVLSRVYLSLQRYDDQANALRQLIRLEGPKPDLLADLGEALTIVEGNVVSKDAKSLFADALRQDASNAKAKFYMALSLEQEGNSGEALAMWKELQNLQPDNDGWQAMISARIRNNKSVSIGGDGPTQEDVEAAGSMNAKERSDMIHSMVARLADRLTENPNNPEGWLRLIRAYTVLGDWDAAKTALQTAGENFANNPTFLRELDELKVTIGENTQ